MAVGMRSFRLPCISRRSSRPKVLSQSLARSTSSLIHEIIRECLSRTTLRVALMHIMGQSVAENLQYTGAWNGAALMTKVWDRTQLVFPYSPSSPGHQGKFTWHEGKSASEVCTCKSPVETIDYYCSQLQSTVSIWKNHITLHNTQSYYVRFQSLLYPCLTPRADVPARDM